MTANFRALIAKNPLIATEFANTGKLVNKPDENQSFPRKKKSPAQVARDKVEAKYVSRKNQCPTCFTAIPLAGRCDCQD